MVRVSRRWPDPPVREVRAPWSAVSRNRREPERLDDSNGIRTELVSPRGGRPGRRRGAHRLTGRAVQAAGNARLVVPQESAVVQPLDGRTFVTVELTHDEIEQATTATFLVVEPNATIGLNRQGAFGPVPPIGAARHPSVRLSEELAGNRRQQHGPVVGGHRHSTAPRLHGKHGS